MLPRMCDRSGGPWAGVPDFSVIIELYQLYTVCAFTTDLSNCQAHKGHTPLASTLKPCAGNTTTVKCMTRCGNTQPHKKSLSLKQDRGRPPGCATCACAYRACSCADGQAASTQMQRCIVQCAEPREARACIQDATCADASGAKEHIAKKLATCRSKRFGARAARRVRVRGEEGGVQTTWRAGSGAAEAAQA